jgi:hypothetical protein
MDGQSQIFQTDKPTRWLGIKWSFRVIIFALLFLITLPVITIFSAKNPQLNLQSNLYTGSKDSLAKLDKKYKKYMDLKNLLQKERGIKKLLQLLKK